MPLSVSYAADVRRRVIQILIVIAPDLPFPTRLIEDVFSHDRLTSGSSERVAYSARSALLAARKAILGVGIPDEFRHDTVQGTLTITAEGQRLLHEQLKRLPPTPQARKRERAKLDDIALTLLVSIFNYASFKSGAISSLALTPEQIRLVYPHFLHMSQARLGTTDGDWGEAQDLATLWLLNDHGVVPKAVLAEYTDVLFAVCEQFYEQWDWDAASMLVITAEEMVKVKSAKAPTIGVKLLDMAETILRTEEDEELREHYLDLARRLRQEIRQM